MVQFWKSVVLRSKMYSIKFQSGVKQSAKGVQKLVKKTLHQDKFLERLLTGVSSRAPMRRIHSANHQIKMTTTNKTALSCFDDKRFILDNGVDTLPYGHYSLNQTPTVTFESDCPSLQDSDCENSSISSEEEEKNFVLISTVDLSDSCSIAFTTVSSFG